jgi:hypothetical protein
MSRFGKEVKMYADNGLRSAAAWISLGRQVATDAKPRANVTSAGEVIELFTRDQTEMRPRKQQSQ